MGVAKDEARAFRLYQAAARQGHAYAQRNLGYMYRYGIGVEQSFPEALRWYRSAAHQGDAGAREAVTLLQPLVAE